MGNGHRQGVRLAVAIVEVARELVGWGLETRCRAVEAMAVVARAVAEQLIPPGTLTLGTDNGAAFTARKLPVLLPTLEPGREVIGHNIDETYPNRPHSGLDYRTPNEVPQTWGDAQELLQKAATEPDRVPRRPFRLVS